MKTPKITLTLCLGALLAAACKPGEVQVKPHDPLDPALTPCAPDVEVFSRTVRDPVLGRCAFCHAEGGLAQGTRFVLADPRLPGAAEKDLAMLEPLAQAQVDGRPLLVAKSTGVHPGGHGGGAVLHPGGPEAEALGFWSAWSRGEVAGCTAPSAATCAEVIAPRALRRLTRAELDATLSDLLGVPSTVGRGWPADPVVDGFTNGAGLEISELHAEKLAEAAEALAAEAVSVRLGALAPCAAIAPDRACAQSFLTRFGRRAFRRPLLASELERYAGLFEQVSRDEGFSAAVRWSIAAMIQSPHFLYRAELGARGGGDQFVLTDWERATALSFTLLGTAPDDALLDAAAAGELSTPAGLEAQLARLRADPRAARQVARMFEEWLLWGRVSQTAHDAATFPELTPAIIADMETEARLLVEDATRSGASLAELLTAEHTFASPALAAYYGLPAPAGSGFQRVATTGTGYGGLLTLGAFTAGMALPAESSPIRRGLLVRTRLLCHELPPPPPNINAAPPGADPTKTTRERFADHSSLPECKGCHRLIDPIGFALEGFDGAGRLRTEDNGARIDVSGLLEELDGRDLPIDGAQSLQAVLAESRTASRCLEETWLRVASGVSARKLSCEVGGAAGDRPLLEVQDDLLASSLFRVRRGGASEGDGPAAGPFPSPEDPVEPTEPTEPVEPGPAGGVRIDLVEQNRWPTGYCADGLVTNDTDEPREWEGTLTIEGRVSNAWNVELTEQGGGRIHVRGLSYNRTAAPRSAAVLFGFCAEL